MAIKRQTFDNGAQGSSVTAASSIGGGDQLDSVTLSGSATVTYEVGSAIHGSKGAHIVAGASSTAIIQFANTSGTQCTGQLYIKFLAFPSTDCLIFQLLTASQTPICGMMLSASGALYIVDSVGAVLKVFSSGNSVALNTPYRLQLQGVPNASTTSGVLAGQIYTDNDILIDSYISGSVNAGTTLTTQYMQVGKLSSAPLGFNASIDDVAFDTANNIAIASVSPFARQNTAESGFDSMAVTTTNTGYPSGDAFSSVTPNSGTITFATNIKHSGNYSYAVAAASGANCNFGWAWNASLNRTQLAVRAYVYLTGAPSAATQLITIGNGGLAASVNVSATGFPQVQDNAGIVSTGSTAITLNTWMRYDINIIVGATTSTGTVSVNIYTGDTVTSPIFTYSSSARNTTTSPLTFMSIGKSSAGGSWSTMYVDDIVLSEFLTTGPVNTATLPWLKL